MNTKRIVITGGPGTGKTCVINELKNKKFYCFEEIIRTMTLDAKKEGDTSTHVSNPIAFVDDPKQFNINLINGRIEQFKQANSINKNICFFDRGIPDVLAYMDFFRQDYGEFFTKPCFDNIYDYVFVLPPWKAIYQSDNERFESFEEAEHIHHHLVNTYTKYGYKLVDVPFDSVESRANYILNIVE